MTDFEKIYRTYFQDVYRYIRRLSGDENLAEEITSDAFFRALRSIDSFRGDCDVRVWLCQIAKNCYYSAVKKAGKTDSLEETERSDPTPSEDSVEDAYLRREEAARTRAVLHQISEPYKEVFMWRVFAELNFKQIGQLFGKTENWACVTYHRAKTMIQAKLEDKPNEK